MGFPDGSYGKESPCSVGDLGLIPGLERSPREKEWQPIPVIWPGEFPYPRYYYYFVPSSLIFQCFFQMNSLNFFEISFQK